MTVWVKLIGEVRSGRGLLLFALILACTAGLAQTASTPAAPVSSEAFEDGIVARSARLSFVSGGDTTIGRSGVVEDTAAQQNAALAQGSQVKTGERGQAEIEFEDGSVARLTPNSALGLEDLRTDADGLGTMTVLRVLRGLVYLEMRAAGVARFRVVAGDDSFWPLENTTVRVNLDKPPALIAVLDGQIHLEHEGVGAKDIDGRMVPNGFKTEVLTGESIRSDSASSTRYFLSEGIATETWDQWNEERDQAAENARANATTVRNNFAGQQGYGWSDLDANGVWYQTDRDGPIWQPGDAVSADFDPYGYGSWTYFPGAGYAWASGYGWGWTPYRCGRWQYWDGFGWGWQPDAFCGSSWRFGGQRLNIFKAPRGYVAVGVPIRPRPGIHPIMPGRHPGEKPPVIARRGDNGGERRLDGLVLRPVRPSGLGTTPHGGSALGSALRQDFPIDTGTHLPVLGLVGNIRVSPPLVQAGGSVQSSRTVRLRSYPAGNMPTARDQRQGGQDRGQLSPTEVVSSGTTGRLMHHGPEAVQGRSMQATEQMNPERSQPTPVPSRIEHSQTVPSSGMGRPLSPPARATQTFQASPRMEQRTAPAPAPMTHSAPAPNVPATASPKK